MAGLTELTERRKDDRAKMAGEVAELARQHGLDAVVTGEQHGSRETSVQLSAPHTLALTVRFRGRSPHSRPDTYVLSWHMSPWFEDGKGWRLAPHEFGDVNPHHGTKATDMARGFAQLRYLLGRRFAAIADGSAFIPDPA